MPNELKPCPFCGAIPNLLYIPSLDKWYYACENEKCSCEPITFAHKNKGVVKRAWNRRADNV